MTDVKHTALTDEQLCAWLDGELPPAEHEAVSTWLRQHPDDAARVQAWRDAEQALREQLPAPLDEPLTPALQALLGSETLAAQPLAAHRPAPGPRWWALAAGLMLASGLLGAWLAGGLGRAPDDALAGGPANWWQRAAVAHAVYVPEQRHPVEVSVQQGDASARREQEAHLARWLTKRLNLPVALFDLQAQGFELVGGRLLPDARGPSAQLMYQRADGRRVTVYLRRPDVDTAAAFRFEQSGGLGLFYWVEAGAGYALVGDLPRAELLALAQAIHRQGAAPP